MTEWFTRVAGSDAMLPVHHEGEMPGDGHMLLVGSLSKGDLVRLPPKVASLCNQTHVAISDVKKETCVCGDHLSWTYVLPDYIRISECVVHGFLWWKAEQEEDET